jgi:hypothetical protein
MLNDKQSLKRAREAETLVALIADINGLKLKTKTAQGNRLWGIPKRPTGFGMEK